MTKIIAALTLLACAFGAQAASHAGAAPMKASEPSMAASGAMKKEKKMKAHKEKAPAADMKKEEMKK